MWRESTCIYRWAITWFLKLTVIFCQQYLKIMADSWAIISQPVTWHRPLDPCEIRQMWTWHNFLHVKKLNPSLHNSEHISTSKYANWHCSPQVPNVLGPPSRDHTVSLQVWGERTPALVTGHNMILTKTTVITRQQGLMIMANSWVINSQQSTPRVPLLGILSGKVGQKSLYTHSASNIRTRTMNK